MLKTIALVVVLAIVGVLGYAASRPDGFQVQRVTRIKAPPDRIQPFIADFKQWPQWSPYEKRDPAMKRVLGAVTQGKGAVYAWEGNSQVGEGRMEIKEATPDTVLIDLAFFKPMATRSVAEFELRPAGEFTDVSWTMRGPSPFVHKLMSVFVDMDKMIGTDFEAGLSNLKSLAEKQA